jgi:hypothetical protein
VTPWEERIAGHIKALGHPIPSAGRQAARELARIGTAAIPALVGALREEHASVRRHALEALVEIGAPAVLPLCETLADATWWLGQPSSSSGQLLSASTALPLTPLFEDEHLLVYARRRAVDVLGRIGDARAVPPLCAALKDEDWFVRREAAAALGQIAERWPVPELRAALPRLRWLQSPWRMWDTVEEGMTYHAALERIEAATVALKELPLPAAASAPSTEGLPLPAAPTGVAPDRLPIPADTAALTAGREAAGYRTFPAARRGWYSLLARVFSRLRPRRRAPP